MKHLYLSQKEEDFQRPIPFPTITPEAYLLPIANPETHQIKYSIKLTDTQTYL